MQIASARLQHAPATCVNTTSRRNRYVRHATRACAMRFEPVAANKAAWATAWKILHFRSRRAPMAPFARLRCTCQRCWQPRTRQTDGACSHSVYGGRPADASQICAFAARPRRRRRRAERVPHTRYTPRPLARETSQNYTPRPLARETSHAKRAQTMHSVGESRHPDRRRPRAVPLVLGGISDREVHGEES